MCKNVQYRVRLYSRDGTEYLSIVDSDDDMDRDIDIISISSDENEEIVSPPIINDVLWGWNSDDDNNVGEENENANNEVLIAVNTVHVDDNAQDGFFDYLNLRDNGFYGNDDNVAADPNRYFLDTAERAWLDAENNVANMVIDGGNANPHFPGIIEQAWLNARNGVVSNDGRENDAINITNDEENNDDGANNDDDQVDEFERVLIGYYVGKFAANETGDDGEAEIDWVYNFLIDEE